MLLLQTPRSFITPRIFMHFTVGLLLVFYYSSGVPAISRKAHDIGGTVEKSHTNRVHH
jgi:hypothetical protein